MGKQNEREIQDDIRRGLESILGDEALQNPQSGNVIIDNSTGTLGDSLQHPNAEPMNLHELKDEAQKDAKKTLRTLIDFYLGSKMIKKNEYAKYKQRIDEMSLSNMMFAIRTAQLAVIKLLEDIDMGNTHPRNFEALVSLNGQMMNMIKHQQALFVTMEEGYKKIKNDQTEIEGQDKVEDVSSEDVTVLAGSFKSRGTKLLMQNLRKTIKTTSDNADNASESVPRLTDARNRPENSIKDLSNESDDAQESKNDIYDDLDEHF